MSNFTLSDNLYSSLYSILYAVDNLRDSKHQRRDLGRETCRHRAAGMQHVDALALASPSQHSNC